VHNCPINFVVTIKFIKTTPQACQLFCDGSTQPTLTTQMIIDLLHKDRHPEKCSDLMELATMNYMKYFLKALESKRSLFNFFLFIN